MSLLGHSLGGLYARCAIATLPWKIPFHDKKMVVELVPNLFITIATPHLGCSSQTYISIPTCIERIVGCCMRQTGRDLFSSSSNNSNNEDEDGLIYTMSTSPQYLQPLSKFQKRIAYCNAFQTDFQVPTATAAFLSPSSTYLHQVIIQQQQQQHHTTTTSSTTSIDNDDDTIVAILQTQPNHYILQNGYHDTNDKITTMSVMLDSLGWEKVFVDLRRHIPTLSINQSTNVTTTAVPTIHDQENDSTPTTTKICTREIWNKFLQQRSTVSKKRTWILSQEIMSYLCHSQNYHIPLGHLVIVANTRNKFTETISSGGRPTVDYYSTQIVNDILCL